MAYHDKNCNSFLTTLENFTCSCESLIASAELLADDEYKQDLVATPRISTEPYPIIYVDGPEQTSFTYNGVIYYVS